MARTDPQFNLRLPMELRCRLEAAAERNRRSVTAEIMARLEDTFVDERFRFTDVDLTSFDQRLKEHAENFLKRHFEAQGAAAAAKPTIQGNAAGRPKKRKTD